MSFTNDPANNPVDRLRLIVGDTDPYEVGLSNDVYNYVLDKNANDEKKSALECLKYLVSKYASYVTEKAGGLFVKESEKFKQYNDLYNRFTKDPSFSLLEAGLPYAGGISNSDIKDNAENPDNNLNNPIPQEVGVYYDDFRV